MIFVGLLAGGTGSRMETAVIPKQFIEVQGIPIFIRSLNTFLSVSDVDKVIISTNAEWLFKYEELLDTFHINRDKVVLTSGGETRFLSLWNITKCAGAITEEDSIIITHDCARIFVSKDIIKSNIEAMNEYNIVTTSIPVIDTVLHSDDGKHLDYVPKRSSLWNDQGPQTYKVNMFLDYASRINMQKIDTYIEAGKLFSENGQTVGIVNGNRLNFKITNDIDLQYAEFLLERGIVS